MFNRPVGNSVIVHLRSTMMRQNASDEVASWGNLKEKPHITIGSTSFPSCVSDMMPLVIPRAQRALKVR